MRIACIQHGNYSEARRVLAGGGAETYNAQRYSVEAFNRFVRGVPHVVVSLGAPAHHEVEGLGAYVGIPPAPARRFVPHRFALWRQARNIIALLEQLKTTHLLLRCRDLIGCEMLQWANRNGVRSAVLLAARLDPGRPLDRRFCELANHDLVAFVANHNRLATASLAACGLRPDKAIAWEFEQAPDLTPTAHAVRTLHPDRPRSVLFAGVMSEAKGAGDLLAAWERIEAQAKDVRLTMLGDGPLRQRALAQAGVRQGCIDAPGRVSHTEVIRHMRRSDLVVVPSRHEFPEGLPMVIQEALALRTPLVMSDHPIFRGYFNEGEGVRFFPARNPDQLARVVREILTNPAAYARLSEATAGAWHSFQIDRKFHHVLDDLAAAWGVPAARDAAATARVAPAPT